MTEATSAKPWLATYGDSIPAEIDANAYTSVVDMLEQAMQRYADRIAFRSFSNAITFADTDRLSRDFAAFLQQELGVKKGDRIAVMVPNLLAFPIAMLGIIRAGAAQVNVNPLYTPREILVVAQDSGMRALLTLDALAPAVLAVRAQTKIENTIITSLAEYSVAATPPAAIEGTLRFADLLVEVDEPDLPRVEINPDEDVAVLQYTGGTTGVPKGAMLTHYNIFANVIQTESWAHGSFRRGEETYLLVIPFFHIYGFTVGMMEGLWRGVQQVLIPKYDVEELLTAIRDYRPTYFPAVPTIYISLLNHPKAREYGIDKVRVFNSGSAPLPVEVIAQFERITGGTLNDGYGLSEASPVTHSTPSLARRKPGSIGLPLPDTEMKIVDLETGTREVPVGSEGELCIAGPQVMKGYWNRPDETAIALRTDAEGRTWLYTGDVARMDEDGYTYIVQRKKDLIIVSGFNVYPSEVEGVLYTHPAVIEAAVIGVPDAYLGEAVKACVVLKSGATTTSEELKEHCEGGLAEFKVPREIEIRESLPKTAVGKVLHRVLREEDQAKG